MTYGRVVHGGVEDVDVLYDIVLPLILPKRANRDAMRAVAPHILHQHIGAVGFERHTIWRALAKEYRPAA